MKRSVLVCSLGLIPIVGIGLNHMKGSVDSRIVAAKTYFKEKMNGQVRFKKTIRSAPRNALQDAQLFTSTNLVYDVCPYQSKIYCATQGGLLVYDKALRQWDVFRTSNGLPENDVRHVAVFEGAAFFVTGGGQLVKEEAGRFLIFSNPEFKITAIHSSPHKLFLGTGQGKVLVFEGRQFRDAFSNIKIPNLGKITALSYDSERSTLWAGSAESGVLSARGVDLNHFTQASGLTDDSIETFLLLPGGAMLVGTQNGLSKIADGRIENYSAPSGLPDNYISALINDDKRQVIGTYGEGLHYFDGISWHTFGEKLNNPYIRCLALDDDKTIWIGTEGGLWTLNKDGVLSLAHQDAGWNKNQMTALLKDSRQNLWVGTFEDGVYVYANGRFTSPDFGDLQPPLEINCLGESQGKIWIGSNQGLYVKDGPSWIRYSENTGLVATPVTTFQEKDGTVWVGTPKGLSEIKNPHIFNYQLSAGLPSNHVTSIRPQGQYLWVGTVGGIARLKRESMEMVDEVTANQGQLSNNWISAIEIRGEQVWVGTYGGGIDYYDGRVWKNIATKPGGLEINPNASAQYNSCVYFGTLSQGLAIIRNEDVRYLTPDDGLPDENVTAVIVTGGDLWVGTTQGLIKFKIPTT